MIGAALKKNKFSALRFSVPHCQASGLCVGPQPTGGIFWYGSHEGRNVASP